MTNNTSVELTKEDFKKFAVDHSNTQKRQHARENSMEDQWDKDRLNAKNRREARKKEVSQLVFYTRAHILTLSVSIQECSFLRSGIPRFNAKYGVKLPNCVLQHEYLADLNSELSDDAVSKESGETQEDRRLRVKEAQEAHHQQLKAVAGPALSKVPVWEVVEQAWESAMVSAQLICKKNIHLNT